MKKKIMKLLAFLFVLTLFFSFTGVALELDNPSDYIMIHYTGSHVAELTSPKSELVFLVVKARIDSIKLEGAEDLMRINVNGMPITKPQLENKGPNWQYADGSIFSYYSLKHDSWNLFYSPDFKSNNLDEAEYSGYSVLQGEAYRYKFDVTEMVIKGDVNKITIKHAADEWIDEYSKEEVRRIKSTVIVVESVEFEGGAREAPTPSVTPTFVFNASNTSQSSEEGTPGFEAVFAIVGLLTVAYIFRKRR